MANSNDSQLKRSKTNRIKTPKKGEQTQANQINEKRSVSIGTSLPTG